MEFQQEELNEILNIFQQESIEIISSMDGKLLLLEKDVNNQDVAIQLFRDAHSLKGSARMLGFDDIQNIAHKIEDIISLVKEKKLILTSRITDTISECLEFIVFLINKTLENKAEYKSDKVQLYIQKLMDVTREEQEEQQGNKKEVEMSPQVKYLLSQMDRIEELIVDILFIISNSRKEKNYAEISNIAIKINTFLSLVGPVEDFEFDAIKNYADRVNDNIDKFETVDNKNLAFLELNDSINLFFETLFAYFDKNSISKKDYYEIVDLRLNSKNLKKDEQNQIIDEKEVKQEKIIDITEEKTEQEEKIEIKPIEIKEEKIEEVAQKIPLIELNSEFFGEVLSEVENLEKNEVNSEIKQIYSNIKEMLSLYGEDSKSIPRDAMLGIKELLEAIKANNPDEIMQAYKKSGLLKKMINFEETNSVKKEVQANVLNQKEILNSITNAQIKTLRIDSGKLDNLVGQIGELIVSKIKTNEQLSTMKKINSELIEWQKNFTKMSYYIKYFDKKYLNSPSNTQDDIHRFMVYNKQLCTLCEQHAGKITGIIKHAQGLFKHLQESETKLNSTTTEIETMVKNMRILPLSTIFQLFPRMVHNIARDKNKKIELVINGADVAADKTIIEEIKIPLVHIIRNSIDHGIEEPAVRKVMGKNPVGRIEINAIYKDSKVIIDVKDDGRGLDVEKIKAKALEKKILTQEEINAISDEELTNLIFYPGFSTEDFVTELSGRGLGLDIVNGKINQLNGRIDIFSQLNQGTVVRIVLPATLATRKAFLLEEQGQLYAIETSVIKTITRINADEIFERNEKSYYIYNGEVIEVFALSWILNLDNTPKETQKYTLAIIETENSLFGMVVEKLISDQEIVHKKLEPPLYKVKHISGITTLANGEACLILDIADIIATIGSKKIGAKIISKHGIIKTRANYNYKVLVVDDSYTTRILQKNILTNYGYNVFSATNPIDALFKVKSTQFDLIVSDVQMPEMNGFEFIGELRKIKSYEDTPVIVVSSEPPEQFKDEIETTKIIKYIQKNYFKQEDYISTIDSVLNI